MESVFCRLNHVTWVEAELAYAASSTAYQDFLNQLRHQEFSIVLLTHVTFINRQDSVESSKSNDTGIDYKPQCGSSGVLPWTSLCFRSSSIIGPASFLAQFPHLDGQVQYPQKNTPTSSNMNPHELSSQGISICSFDYQVTLRT